MQAKAEQAVDVGRRADLKTDLKADLKADLHIHSRVSDGSVSIPGIISRAKDKSLDVIAITDHDTTSHFSQIPTDTGRLKVIPGIEISAKCHESGKGVHVLGYGIARPEIVEELVHPLLVARGENSERQVQILRDAGYDIEPDKLMRADGTYLYKQHIMEWLVDTGQSPDMFGDFYKSIFKGGGICDIDIEYIEASDAVRTIKEAGGLAVLAHPGKSNNAELIPMLVEVGLDGIELNHHAHDEDDRAVIRDYAQKYGLFLTGGSDYHGAYEPQPFGIGDYISEQSGVVAILEHIAAQQQ